MPGPAWKSHRRFPSFWGGEPLSIPTRQEAAVRQNEHTHTSDSGKTSRLPAPLGPRSVSAPPTPLRPTLNPNRQPATSREPSASTFPTVSGEPHVHGQRR